MTHEQWLRAISSTIGGSMAPAVLGVSRWRTPLDAWRSILDAREGKPIREIETDDMRRGKMLEPLALKLLGEAIGTRVRPHNQDLLCRRDDWPWAHALPDGWCDDGWIVEVKVPRPGACERVAASGPLEEWVVQCQHNSAVCRTEGCHLGVLNPVSMRIVHFALNRDDEMVDRIREAEQQFWQYVEKGEPPEPSGRAENGQQGKHPEPPPAPSSIPLIDRDEVRSLIRDYLALAESEEEIAAAKREVVAKLDALVGPVEVYEIEGVDAIARGREWPRVRVYRTATKSRRTFDWKSAVAVHPDLDDDRYWKVGKPSRPFRVFPIAGS